MKNIFAVIMFIMTASYMSGVEANVIPLGPLGGSGEISTGKSEVQIKTLTSDAPGAKSGLRVNDVIFAAFGFPFSETPKEGYLGATQDLAFAIERAEAGDGKLPLTIMRPGKGELTITIRLPAIGAYGATFPVGSKKFMVTYEYACQKIAERITQKGGDHGFNSGWFGLALLGHPKWNKVYAKQIIMLKDEAIKKFSEVEGKETFAYAPVEETLLDGKTKNPHHEKNSTGPGNWELGSWVMFLAEYRRKTKDKSVDPVLQRAAEMCANRIQWWKQPPLAENKYSPEFKDIAGIVSHGGVAGDYIHIGWGGGINMTGVHIFSALALAKQAGVNMKSAPKDGHYFGYLEPPAGAVPKGMEKKDFTLSEKFDMQWEWLIRCSGKAGSVGYTTGQGGSPGDASGRTSGALFGILSSGQKLTPEDTKRVELMKTYLTTEYHRLMEAHAYTHGGQCFYQLALPYLADRNQRYIRENWRLFYILSRQPNGTCGYFGSRGNNGGDGYLDFDKVTETIWALTGSIAFGDLPYIKELPAKPKNYVAIQFTEPYVYWPSLKSKATNVSGLVHEFQFEARDANGALIMSKSLQIKWSAEKSGVLFEATKKDNGTQITFPEPGEYALLLKVTNGSFTVDEPLVVHVKAAPTEAPPTIHKTESPSIKSQPVGKVMKLGGDAEISIAAHGRGPLQYTWRLNGADIFPAQNADTLHLSNIGGGQAGNYDCVITGADGTVTSNVAKVIIEDCGTIVSGGLWCEQFTDLSFQTCNKLDDFINHVRFPRWSDASYVVSQSIETEPLYGKHGRRLSGWITPPESGAFQFFVAGHGHIQVQLSSDDLVRNRQPILTFSGTTKPREWQAGQKSQPIHLSANKRYYIEMLLFSYDGKASTCAMTWRTVTNEAGQRKDDPGPENGSSAMPGSLFEYRVGGMFDDIKVSFPTK